MTRSGEASPLNISRDATVSFLDAFADYLRTGTAVPPFETHSAEEIAQKLADFRAGRIRPKTPVSTAKAQPHHTRMRELRRQLEELDAVAITPAYWWHTTIQEAADDLP